jgi:hypothetical protein
VFATVVRASIAYAESAEGATSILDYRPTWARTTWRSPTKCCSGCRGQWMPAGGSQQLARQANWLT